MTGLEYHRRLFLIYGNGFIRKTLQGQRESSGLGLPMVQWIVKEHGGVIQVSSKKGEGTCF